MEPTGGNQQGGVVNVVPCPMQRTKVRSVCDNGGNLGGDLFAALNCAVPDQDGGRIARVSTSPDQSVTASEGECIDRRKDEPVVIIHKERERLAISRGEDNLSNARIVEVSKNISR